MKVPNLHAAKKEIESRVLRAANAESINGNDASSSLRRRRDRVLPDARPPPLPCLRAPHRNWPPRRRATLSRLAYPRTTYMTSRKVAQLQRQQYVHLGDSATTLPSVFRATVASRCRAILRDRSVLPKRLLLRSDESHGKKCQSVVISRQRCQRWLNER